MKRAICLFCVLSLLCAIPLTVYAGSVSGEIEPRYVGIMLSAGRLDIENGNCIVNGYVQARSGYEPYITATLYERSPGGAWRSVASWTGVETGLAGRKAIDNSYPATYGKEYMAHFSITAYLGNTRVDDDNFYTEVDKAY